MIGPKGKGKAQIAIKSADHIPPHLLTNNLYSYSDPASQVSGMGASRGTDDAGIGIGIVEGVIGGLSELFSSISSFDSIFNSNNNDAKNTLSVTSSTSNSPNNPNNPDNPTPSSPSSGPVDSSNHRSDHSTNGADSISKNAEPKPAKPLGKPPKTLLNVLLTYVNVDYQELMEDLLRHLPMLERDHVALT